MVEVIGALLLSRWSLVRLWGCFGGSRDGSPQVQLLSGTVGSGVPVLLGRHMGGHLHGWQAGPSAVLRPRAHLPL